MIAVTIAGSFYNPGVLLWTTGLIKKKKPENDVKNTSLNRLLKRRKLFSL